MGRVVRYQRNRSRGTRSGTRQQESGHRTRQRRKFGLLVFYLAIIAAGAVGSLVAGNGSADLASRIPSASEQANVSSQAAAQDELVGRASIVDGDTITISGQDVRFNGIDAPESEQRCTNASGANYACGRVAANALDKFLAASRPTRCVFVEWDQYGRFVGDCYRADGESVARWLVRNGHAMDWPLHSDGAYAADQGTAWEARKGIWAGEVQPPWEWRAERRTGAEPKVVERAPQSLLSGGCDIKGNISKKGERIYHVPGQKYYGQTKIDRSKGERMFCSEAEARAAGWRRSKI